MSTDDPAYTIEDVAFPTLAAADLERLSRYGTMREVTAGAGDPGAAP